MAVTAVTEQQISMTGAYPIRSRLVDAFADRPPGVPADDQLAAFYLLTASELDLGLEWTLRVHSERQDERPGPVGSEQPGMSRQ
jgi:hypothetical protein